MHRNFLKNIVIFHLLKDVKRGYQIGNTKRDKRGVSPVFELDRWNFQQMLDFGFSETLQSLSSFKQLLFSSFHRDDQRKKKIYLSFPCRDPLLKLKCTYIIKSTFIAIFVDMDYGLSLTLLNYQGLISCFFH